MSIDVARLGKTLNDETRLRILRFLKQRGRTSYIGLMSAVGITNTGRFNYHLKVLGDLIRKEGPEGWYELSEKGTAAIDFLDNFQRLTQGVRAGYNVAPIPYEKTARSLRVVLALELIAVALISLYAYLNSSAQVPIQYNFDGQLFTSAPKEIFLLLAALLNVPQGIFLLLSGVRYRLINRYPFAISLPGFASNLSQMDYERRGYWINRLFSAILVVGAIVGGMMVFLTASIYASSLASVGLPASAVLLTLLVIGVAVAGLLYYSLGFSKEMAAGT